MATEAAVGVRTWVCAWTGTPWRPYTPPSTALPVVAMKMDPWSLVLQPVRRQLAPGAPDPSGQSQQIQVTFRYSFVTR